MIILNLCGVIDIERSMLHYTLSREQCQSSQWVELKTIQRSIHLMLWCWQHFRRFWFNNDDEFPASRFCYLTKQLNSIINLRAHNSFFLRFPFVIALVFYLFIYSFLFGFSLRLFIWIMIFFYMKFSSYNYNQRSRWSQQPAIIDRPFIKSRNLYYSKRIV